MIGGWLGRAMATGHMLARAGAWPAVLWGGSVRVVGRGEVQWGWRVVRSANDNVPPDGGEPWQWTARLT